MAKRNRERKTSFFHYFLSLIRFSPDITAMDTRNSCAPQEKEKRKISSETKEGDKLRFIYMSTFDDYLHKQDDRLLAQSSRMSYSYVGQ
jgi:hypothetical protein